MALNFEIPQWHDHAACRGHGPDQFFIDPGQSSAAAKALCNHCPVVEQCLADALDHPWLLGIWGGTTERQRLAIRRRRAQNAA